MDFENELSDFSLMSIMKMAREAKQNNGIYKFCGTIEISFEELMFVIHNRKENGENIKKENINEKILKKLAKLSDLESDIRTSNMWIERYKMAPLGGSSNITQEKIDTAVNRELEKIKDYEKTIKDIIEHNPHIEPHWIMKKLTEE